MSLHSYLVDSPSAVLQECSDYLRNQFDDFQTNKCQQEKMSLLSLFLELHDSEDQFRKKLQPFRTTGRCACGVVAAPGTASECCANPAQARNALHHCHTPPVTDRARTHTHTAAKTETVDAL